MALNIKGFISIRNKITNEPNKIDPLGELPMYCITYGKEIGLYNHVNFPELKLYTLNSKDESGNDVELSLEIQEEILNTYNKVKEFCDANVKPLNKNECIKFLRDELALYINNIAIGKFVDSGYDSLPSWVSWESINFNYRCKIWLSGDVLLYDYDEYSITVIPPIENVDDFFLGSSYVESELSKRPIETLMDLANEAKDQYPETITKLLTYEYKDPSSGRVLKTNWVVLIYGIAGDNTDAIKDAINDYCIEHSDKDRSEWMKIFKELFSRTEFVLIPRFDIHSIPNLYTIEGLYRSILDPQETLIHCANKISFYDRNHILNNVRIFPYDYKGIMICSIAGDTNMENFSQLEKIFPDYIPVSSTSTDFMRMCEETREWCLKIEEMLKICENLDENTDIPKGYRRIKRDNKLFLSITIGKVYYLMLSGKF